MYLVELRPGKEELYRSGDELAAAIRRGDVDVHSRIYHRATSKWISVTLHPQFKAIVAERQAEPLPPLERSSWTYLNAQSETLEVREDEVEGNDAGSGIAPSAQGRTAPWRRLFGLGVAGIALVLGVQLAFSGPRPPWADGAAARPEAVPARAEEPAATEDGQLVSLASSSRGWVPAEDEVVEEAPAPARVVPAPAPLPRAPRLRVKALNDAMPEDKTDAPAGEANTVEGLLAGYLAAYDSARTRLESGIRVARLHQLFATTRLTASGGVTDTRLSLAGVANFIRVYREQEAVIEREYQDSFSVLSKEHEWPARSVRQWYGRQSQKESAEAAALASRLVAGIDSLLGVLDDQAGAYRLGEETIAFDDVTASRRYGELRRQITGLVDSARANGAGEQPGPLGYLLEAVGTTRLPREI